MDRASRVPRNGMNRLSSNASHSNAWTRNAHHATRNAPVRSYGGSRTRNTTPSTYNHMLKASQGNSQYVNSPQVQNATIAPISSYEFRGFLTTNANYASTTNAPISSYAFAPDSAYEFGGYPTTNANYSFVRMPSAIQDNSQNAWGINSPQVQNATIAPNSSYEFGGFGFPTTNDNSSFITTPSAYNPAVMTDSVHMASAIQGNKQNARGINSPQVQNGNVRADNGGVIRMGQEFVGDNIYVNTQPYRGDESLGSSALQRFCICFGLRF